VVELKQIRRRRLSGVEAIRQLPLLNRYEQRSKSSITNCIFSESNSRYDLQASIL
jgi:hypothetical protein